MGIQGLEAASSEIGQQQIEGLEGCRRYEYKKGVVSCAHLPLISFCIQFS